jgi:hypothetical protein
MTAPRRKSAAKKPPATQVTIQIDDKTIAETTIPADEPTPEETIPEPTQAVRILAQTVRAFASAPGARFELAPGVIGVFGYSGLSRVLPGNAHVHIATEQELAGMSDQQIHDAVMQAGTR